MSPHDVHPPLRIIGWQISLGCKGRQTGYRTRIFAANGTLLWTSAQITSTVSDGVS